MDERRAHPYLSVASLTPSFQERELFSKPLSSAVIHSITGGVHVEKTTADDSDGPVTEENIVDIYFCKAQYLLYLLRDEKLVNLFVCLTVE